MNRLFLGAVVFASLALFGQEHRRLRVGDKAPPVSESPVTNRRLAVVFLPAVSDSAACKSEIEAIARLQTRLRKVNVLVTAVIPYEEAKWRTVCPAAQAEIRFVYDTYRKLADVYGASNERLGIFVDEQGIIRRVVRTASPRLPDTLAEDVASWNQGQGIYDATCARCHGPDGSNTGYAEIKTLNGIGNRMDEAEIIRRTSLTSNVDLSSFNEDRFRALAVYVAGL